MLVTAFTRQGFRGRHPEVIGIGSYDAERLLDGQFDLKAQAINSGNYSAK